MVEISHYDISPFLNSFDDGVCCINTKGELLYTNEIAKKHWNFQAEHEQKLLQLPPVMKALKGKQVHHVLINRNERHVLLLNTIPLHDADNMVSAVVLVSQDVSEHIIQERQAELALDIFVKAIVVTQDTHDTYEAMKRIAELLPQLDSVDSSVAFRVDESTNLLDPIALYGNSRMNYKEWRSELSSMELNTERALRSSSAYMRALRLKTPIAIDFTPRSSRRTIGNLRAAIYAPVLLNGHVLGLLGVERQRALGNADMYFPQWSVDLLQALARLVSMSIERTSLYEASAQQQQEIDAVRALLQQKEMFLSLTAHELKNPLTSIRGLAQILQRRIKRTQTHAPDSNNELLESLKSIEHQTKKIEHMVNALMDVSRMDLDRLQLELKNIDVLALVKQTIEEYIPIAQDHRLQLIVNGRSVTVSEDDNKEEQTQKEHITIKGDAERLEQVLLNLISNAIKYSPNSDVITVSLRDTHAGTVEISVIDNGIGIQAKEIERLTERFFRAQNAQSVDTKGLGLGLYLVDTLVSKHGGTLSIKSEGIPGKGSTFTLTLPTQE